jgi:addiction module RelB/DinJ family antitoxin
MNNSTTKTQINLKVDKKTKTEAQKLAKKLGLSLSSIVNASLNQFIARKEVHFSVEPKMTPYLEAIIAEVEEDIKENRNISPAFGDSDSAIAYLKSL